MNVTVNPPNALNSYWAVFVSTDAVGICIARAAERETALLFAADALQKASDSLQSQLRAFYLQPAVQAAIEKLPHV